MSPIRLRHGGGLLTATLACTALAGCGGVPRDTEPQVIQRPLPAELREKASSSTTSPTAESREATLFLVGSSGDTDVLVPLLAEVSVPDSGRFPEAVLQALRNEPTNEHTELNLRSNIPEKVLFREVRQTGNSLTVDLSNLENVENRKLRYAVAQIVFTATAIDGIEHVVFLVDGKPTTMPLDEGTSAAGQALNRGDFPRLQAFLSQSPGAPAAPSSTAPPPG